MKQQRVMFHQLNKLFKFFEQILKKGIDFWVERAIIINVAGDKSETCAFSSAG